MEDVALYRHYLRNYKHYNLNIGNYNIKKNIIEWDKKGINKCVMGNNPQFNVLIDKMIE